MEKKIEREVAWRIFAYEFNKSDLYLSEGDERAPNYIITPTGVKCNRLFIVGVVTEVETIGIDNNLWKARIADPTGVFTLYAGQYQPEAAIFLSELEVPSFAVLVGKARKYEPEQGNVYLSVRPEEVNVADEKLRDRWVVDTAERTLERINVIEKATGSGLSGKELREFLQKEGLDAVQVDGTVKALEHYKNLDKFINELKNVITRALQSVISEIEDTVSRETDTRESGIEQGEHEPYEQETGEIDTGKPVAEEVSAQDKETDRIVEETGDEPEPKEVIASIIDKLDTGKGVSYSEITETGQKAGLETEVVELSIKELMAEGRCYEPKIGILRKV